ncbi:protein ALP1-like [Nasonia vitripennis]|uniref:DDE Tnp4 domain-containing protein n=1 Tax=Nasonia vitripennis TaxID=7425 RepID=A0A7M7Q3M0_NASVI|nr:protein ALP1-like [Nasonia vitripennis]
MAPQWPPISNTLTYMQQLMDIMQCMLSGTNPDITLKEFKLTSIDGFLTPKTGFTDCVICNDKLEFIHCYAGLPGSVHDTRVFRYSGVQQRCTDEYFPNNTHLLGDSAYTLQNHVIVPYRDNGHLTVEEVHFNHVLSSTRMMVEMSIGLLKVRWRYFLDKLPMRRTDLIPYYIVCACVLHNICLKVEDTFEYPVIIPDTIDVNPEPMDVNIAEHQDAIAKRENLTNIVNADIL